MEARKRAVPGAGKHRRPLQEYIAAVRYLDGSRDIFHVRNADDMEDARALVLSELGDIQAVVIAPRH